MQLMIYIHYWLLFFKNDNFNSIQDGPFRSSSRAGGPKRPPLPKICHTYSTMMKLCTLIPYKKKNQNTGTSHDTPLEFCWHQHFSPGICKYCYIKKYRYRLHFDTLFLIPLTFFESWNDYNFDDVSKNSYSRPS